MAKSKKTTALEKYNAPFAVNLRNFMDIHPVTGAKTTQKQMADYLGVRPQTVSCYCMGESIPDVERLMQIKEYFGVSADFLITGERLENAPIRDTLGLSETTIEKLKLVKENYFEDTPQMLYMLDYLLGDQEFYFTLERASDIADAKRRLAEKRQQFEEEHGEDSYGYAEDRRKLTEQSDFLDWKMTQIFESYFVNYANRDYKKAYFQSQWDKVAEQNDAAIAKEEAELQEGYAAYRATHPEPESADDLIAEMAAENGEN